MTLFSQGHPTLVLCHGLNLGFDGGFLVGKIVADRSTIIVFGSRSEPRLSSRATRILTLTKP